MTESTRSFSVPAPRGLLRLLTASGAALLIGLACARDQMGPAETAADPAGPEQPMGSYSPSNGCYSNPSVNFVSLVSCGTTTVSVNSVTYQTDVENGLSHWTLQGSPIQFSFQPTFASGEIQVVVTGGGPWCGENAGNVITIKTSGCNASAHKVPRDQMANLIAHELGNYVGFEENYDSGFDGTAGHCIMNLPDPLNIINASACPFEATFLATMQQSGGPTVDRSKHFATGVKGNVTSLTLDVGQSAALSPSAVLLGSVNGSICPEFTDDLGVTHQPTNWESCTVELPLDGFGIGVTHTGGVTHSAWNGSSSTATGITRGSASVSFALTSAASQYYLFHTPTTYDVAITVLAPGLSVFSGEAQQGLQGATLPLPLKVRVMDGGVQPISGRTVTFVPASGSGTVSVPSAVTDIDGYAQVTWTLGANASQSVVATLTGPTVQSVTFTATVAGPDLRVTSITGPSTVPLYATSAVGYTLNVRNWGSEGIPIETNWIFGLAMSSDQTYSSNDPRVDGGSGPGPLAADPGPGNTGIRSVFFTPPASAIPGTVYLVANLDTTNAVGELDEANNTGASSAITLTANGDMRVDSIYGPASMGPGASGTIPIVVKNHGTDPARPAKVKIYLSTDNVLSAGDSLIGSLTDNPLMTAGVKRTENVSVTVPAGMPLANYYLIAKVDADSTVYESNEGNNTLVRPTQLTVAAPTFPDLTVLSIIPQIEEAYYGNSYQWIKGSARNAGNASTPANWVGRLYLSTDQTWDAGDILVASTTFGSLAPSTNVSIATTAGVPGSAGGNYYLIYRVDATGIVTESNEGNNTIVSTSTVYVEGLP